MFVFGVIWGDLMTVETRWWFGLTTIERKSKAKSSMLPGWARGASAWIAVFAADSSAAQAMIEREVDRRGDQVFEIVGEPTLPDAEQIALTNSNLAEKLKSTDPAETPLVWSDLHFYD